MPFRFTSASVAVTGATGGVVRVATTYTGTSVAVTVTGSAGTQRPQQFTFASANSHCIGSSSTFTSRRNGTQFAWRYSGTPLVVMAPVGAIPGVKITDAAGLNGPGVGMIRSGSDGTLVSWRAPCSMQYGPPVDVSAGGTFYALDGDTPDKWIKLVVTAAWLAAGPRSAEVSLHNRYGDRLTAGDISAVTAAAGVVQNRTLSIANLGSTSLANVAIWIDPDAGAGIQISWDNVTYYSPTTEADAVAGMGVQTLAGSGTHALYLRRTITAGAAADPQIAVVLHAAWDSGAGGGDRAYSDARDLYRVANAAQYRAYWKLGSNPTPGVDTPNATGTTLPLTPSVTLGNGTWYIALTYFDGYLESDPLKFIRLDIAAGAVTNTPPTAPDQTWHEEGAAGVLTVHGVYNPVPDTVAGVVADQWALWYTTNGTTPGSGSPAYTETMVFDRGFSHFSYDLPAQADGVVVKTLLKTRRVSGAAASENTTPQATTISTVGPDVPEDTVVIPIRR